MTERSEQQRFTAAVLGRVVVADVAQCCAAADIPVLPLKGVLLQQLLYDDATERAVSDVDLLVSPSHHRRAVALLVDAGYALRDQTPAGTAVSLTSPKVMVVDLHRSLFSRSRYRMPTPEVMARSTLDTTLFRAPVQVMCPKDLYAHLVGKVASDHVDGREAWRLEDVGRAPARLGLEAGPVAEHLQRCGVARAARYVLPMLAEDDFAAAVLRLLPPDPLGAWLGRAARLAVSRTSRGSLVGALSAHLLNRSVPAALASAGWASIHRIGHSAGFSAPR